jgi:hypothetical protein
MGLGLMPMSSSAAKGWEDIRTRKFGRRNGEKSDRICLSLDTSVAEGSRVILEGLWRIGKPKHQRYAPKGSQSVLTDGRRRGL